MDIFCTGYLGIEEEECVDWRGCCWEESQVSKVNCSYAIIYAWFYRTVVGSLAIHRVNLGAFLDFVRKMLFVLLTIPRWTVVSNNCVSVCILLVVFIVNSHIPNPSQDILEVPKKNVKAMAVVGLRAIQLSHEKLLLLWQLLFHIILIT